MCGLTAMVEAVDDVTHDDRLLLGGQSEEGGLLGADVCRQVPLTNRMGEPEISRSKIQ